MTSKDNKQKGDDNDIELAVSAAEFGLDQETGDTLYKVHVAPIYLTKKQYELVDHSGETPVIKARVVSDE
jgi:hypothetical protein